MIKIKTWNRKIQSDKAGKENHRFIKIYLNQTSETTALKRDFSLMKFTKERSLISEICSNKCMFCETKGRFELSLFRPLSLTKYYDNDSVSDGYWWLAYDISNFIYICNECNRSKKNYFPVKGKRANFPTSYDKIDKAEKRLIIDPRFDQPEKHLKFTKDGEVIALTRKGQFTIEIFDLNRISLIKKRKNTVVGMLKEFSFIKEEMHSYKLPIVESNITFLNEEFKDESEFSGLKRWVLTSMIKEMGISKYFSKSYKLNSYLKDEPRRKIKTYNQCNEINQIEIKNFMGIKNTKIVFNSKYRNLVIVGNNGSGKSSLLKAISFLSLTDTQRDRFLIENRNTVYRYGKNKQSKISLFYNNGQQKYSVEIDGDLNEVNEKGDKPRFRLLGYGPNRLNTQNEYFRKPKPSNVFPLMKPFYFLSHSHLWLSDESIVNEKLFENIAYKISELFQLKPKHVARDSGDLEFKIGSSFERFQDLSEGYKSVLNIILDIIMNFSEETYDFDLLNGVVLIDEIENHLHPIWKREIIGFLFLMFPNIQFIISSHDPLVLHSAENTEVLKFSRQMDEIMSFPLPRGRNTDEVLTSDMFGLVSTMDRETSKLYRDYLSKISTSGFFDKDLEDELRNRMGNFAETSLERMAHEVVARHVVEKFNKLSSTDKLTLKSKLRRLLDK